MAISGNTPRFLETSPQTIDYNCIAWAAEDVSQWWWPDKMLNGYWPEEVAREETLDAFIAVCGLLGYQVCDDSKLEVGYRKIAIYIDANGKPTHAARQLDNGNWTSKLGPSFDIEHDFLVDWPDIVIDVIPHRTSDYGRCAVILRKLVVSVPNVPI